ncbi:MAG: alpha/beta hydrolase [Candidatus Pacebacteria bacterium]|nr:alpha/beta hydrolase [Candidatus Paceibacterota bacterium]
MKKQVIVIHGGGVFVNYKEYIAFLKKREISIKNNGDWKRCLGEKLGKDFEVIIPAMPNYSNAKYLEWKIWFEKLFPYLKDSVVLVGHSLGAIFLTRYLSENKFPKRILATVLVAAPYDDRKSAARSAGFVLKENLSLLQNQSGELIFYHSRDDKSVSFECFKKYNELLPEASFKEFKGRGHFQRNSFPEIIREIRKVFK